MKQPQEVDRQTSLTLQSVSITTKGSEVTASNDQHFNYWPNAAGFNALNDTRTRIELKTSGYFPDYVAGSLYRTGPGGYKVPRNNPKDGNVEAGHWFDGFTTVHKFDLVPGDDGNCKQVFYTSRNQVDEMIEKARSTGVLDGVSFAHKRDPCDTLYKKMKTIFSPILPSTPQKSNVGVVFQPILPQELERAKEMSGDLTYRRLISTTTDARTTKQLDADTLEPLGVTNQSDLHPSLSGQLSASHASHDPKTGEMFNYNLAMGARAVYRVFCVRPKTGEVEILAEISASDIPPAYLHSLFVTDNFVVLCVWTAHFKANGAPILWHRNLLDAIAPFDPTAKTIWLVVDRHHKRGFVKRFESPPFFCFHTINAWEEPSANQKNEVDLLCELTQFHNLDILHKFYYRNLVSDAPHAAEWATKERRDAGLARYRLSNVPLTSRKPPSKSPFYSSSKTATAAEKILFIPCPRAGDLPRINPHYALKPHRYVWSVLDRGKSSFVDGLVKTDTQAQEALVWEFEKHSPGEPIFVPKPGATEEDEGVLLVVVLNGETGTSYLLCLDARDMSEIGRAEVGKAVGFGFHGIHLKGPAL